MVKKILIIAVIFAVFFGAKGIWDAVQPEPEPVAAGGQAVDLVGEWRLAEMRTAGIYGESLETARALVGREVTIRDGAITSGFAPDCKVPPLQPVTLKDDMETFGSSGGSWSELGLKPVGESRDYEVLQAKLDCAAPFTKIIAQPESDLYLLSHHEIYLLLTRR